MTCGPEARNDRPDLWLVCEVDPATAGDVAGQAVRGRSAGMRGVRSCGGAGAPATRRHYTALRVSSHDVVGVWGAIYLPGHARPVTVNGVAFDDPLRWVKVANLIVHLRDFTVVGLDVRDQHAG